MHHHQRHKRLRPPSLTRLIVPVGVLRFWRLERRQKNLQSSLGPKVRLVTPKLCLTVFPNSPDDQNRRGDRRNVYCDKHTNVAVGPAASASIGATRSKCVGHRPSIVSSVPSWCLSRGYFLVARVVNLALVLVPTSRVLGSSRSKHVTIFYGTWFVYVHGINWSQTRLVSVRTNVWVVLPLQAPLRVRNVNVKGVRSVSFFTNRSSPPWRPGNSRSPTVTWWNPTYACREPLRTSRCPPPRYTRFSATSLLHDDDDECLDPAGDFL